MFDESYNLIYVTPKDKIRSYNSKQSILNAMTSQLEFLINKFNIKNDSINALGIASPGPINIQKGIILDT